MISRCLSAEAGARITRPFIRRWNTTIIDARGIRRRRVDVSKPPPEKQQEPTIMDNTRIMNDYYNNKRMYPAETLARRERERERTLKGSVSREPKAAVPGRIFRANLHEMEDRKEVAKVVVKKGTNTTRKEDGKKMSRETYKVKALDGKNHDTYKDKRQKEDGRKMKHDTYNDKRQKEDGRNMDGETYKGKRQKEDGRKMNQEMYKGKMQHEDGRKMYYETNKGKMEKKDGNKMHHETYRFKTETEDGTKMQHEMEEIDPPTKEEVKKKRWKELKKEMRGYAKIAPFKRIPGESEEDEQDRLARYLEQKFDPKQQPQKKRERPKTKKLPLKAEETPLRRHPPEHLSLYISAHPGLQTVVHEELVELGYKYTEKGNGAVVNLKSMKDVLRCHVWVGGAARMFLHCGEPFTARALGELERKTAKLFPWEDLIDCRGGIPHVEVKAVASKSRLIHSTAISQRVMKGIYNVIGEPTCPEKLHLSLQIYQDSAVLSFDTMNGDPLYRRGYRVSDVTAPLREDMAYALLWKSKMREYDAVFDPFCGSGTIPIEAATMAAGLPPGHLLPPPLKGTALFNEKLWNKVKKERRDSLDIKVYASDRDQEATEATKQNLEQAGVDIEVDKLTFSAHPMWEERDKKVLMVTNPPYGVRLKQPNVENKRLINRELYQTLAKRMNAWKVKTRNGGVILTNNRHSWRPAGFAGDFSYMLSFVHGGISVIALEYDPSKVPESPNQTKDANDVQCQQGILETLSSDDESSPNEMEHAPDVKGQHETLPVESVSSEIEHAPDVKGQQDPLPVESMSSGDESSPNETTDAPEVQCQQETLGSAVSSDDELPNETKDVREVQCQ